MKKKIILITGSAGFIGYHVSKLMMKKNHIIIGLDNLNNYYDVKLKKERIHNLIAYSKRNKFKFLFKKLDISDSKPLKRLFTKYKITHVVNLAAQAGVRYSITNPESYIKSNFKCSNP